MWYTTWYTTCHLTYLKTATSLSLSVFFHVDMPHSSQTITFRLLNKSRKWSTSKCLLKVQVSTINSTSTFLCYFLHSVIEFIKLVLPLVHVTQINDIVTLSLDFL